MNMSKNKTNRFMPFIMAFCVVIGIIIGTFFSNHFSGNRLNVINSGSNRLNNLLHLILLGSMLLVDYWQVYLRILASCGWDWDLYWEMLF